MCIAFAIMFIGLSILDIEYALLIALGIAFWTHCHSSAAVLFCGRGRLFRF